MLGQGHLLESLGGETVSKALLSPSAGARHSQSLTRRYSWEMGPQASRKKQVAFSY